MGVVKFLHRVDVFKEVDVLATVEQRKEVFRGSVLGGREWGGGVRR